MKRLCCLMLTLVLSACSVPNVAEKFAPAEQQAIARAYLQRLFDDDIGRLYEELDAPLKSQSSPAIFTQMRNLVPKEAPLSIELIGYQSHRSGGTSSYNVSYEYHFPGQWLLLNAAWREQEGAARVIIGLRVQPIQESLRETNAFGFKRAGPLHYLVLATALGVPAFVLITLVACLRTRFPRRKWLWTLGVLVGLAQFTLNWSTGGVNFHPFAVLLLGVSAFSAGPHAPWMISVGFPLGALWFWIKRPGRSSIPPPIPPAAGESAR